MQSRLLQDIQAQPQSLAQVLLHQSGPGRDALLRAAVLLSSGKRVIITAIGASMAAAVPLEYSLSAHGIATFLIEAGELLHYRQQVCLDSVVLIVSRSGASVEITKLLNILKGRAQIIGVSNDPASLLGREADVSIHIGSLPDEMVAIQSYTGTVLTLHLLGEAVVKGTLADDPEVHHALAEIPSLIAGEVETMSKWDEFLKLGSPVYLLGRGPSVGSVAEGALLFHETAKAPAVGMLAASFRHGPVELVDKKFTGVVFAPAGRTRNLNLALARDISRFGGCVRVIGPAGADADGLGLCPIPEVAERLAPLLEVIPLQCAALRLAQLRGLNIGTFRYTPQVTRDEASFAR